MPFMGTRNPRLGADERGGAAVEFAFAAPVLILLVVGIIEIAMVLFINTMLEGAVREAARYGITGYTVAGQTREQTIRQIVQDRTLGLIDMANLKIDYIVYPSFGDIGKPEQFTDSNHNGKYDTGESFVDTNGNGKWDSDMGAAGAGNAGDVVVYRLSYDWPLLTGLLNDLIGTNGKMSLRASVAVRNEPYNVTAIGP